MTIDDAPHPEDPRKPDSPTDIKPPNWKFVLKNTLREFNDDGLSDAAAGLTYFTVLSLFPGIIALVSILSLVGQSGELIRNLKEAGLEEPASTRLLVYAGLLVRGGLDLRRACELAIAAPISDDPAVLEALLALIGTVA